MLIDYLIQISKLPLPILRLPAEERFSALINGIWDSRSHRTTGNHDKESRRIEPIKWKAIKLSRLGSGPRGVQGRGWKDAHSAIKIVGTYRSRKNRERSAARIQYLQHPMAKPKRSPEEGLFGKVKFFLSLENPRYKYPPANELEEEETNMTEEPPELLLAVIEVFEVEYTSDKVLLRTKER